MNLRLIRWGVEGDHVHIFLSVPPKDSLAKIVEVLKGISPKEVFEEFPELDKELWAGSFGVMGVL